MKLITTFCKLALLWKNGYQTNSPDLYNSILWYKEDTQIKTRIESQSKVLACWYIRICKSLMIRGRIPVTLIDLRKITIKPHRAYWKMARILLEIKWIIRHHWWIRGLSKELATRHKSSMCQNQIHPFKATRIFTCNLQILKRFWK